MSPPGDERDSLAPFVQAALDGGWLLVPQVGYGVCDNALIRTGQLFTDLVTIPRYGNSTVVRLQGGPAPGWPRRTGHEWWRHHVPPEPALQWLLADPDTDELLLRWTNGADHR